MIAAIYSTSSKVRNKTTHSIVVNNINYHSNENLILQRAKILYITIEVALDSQVQLKVTLKRV